VKEKEMERFDLEGMRLGMHMAYKVGAPISVQLPVPAELSAICNVVSVKPGERVWVPTTVDADDDVILDVDTTNAIITTVKVDPINETQLSFKQLNSRLERVNLPTIIDAPNGDLVMAARKASITRGMDKTELRILMSAIFNSATTRANGGAPTNQAVQTVTADSNDDLYEVIAKMVQKAEDYCSDDYTLFAGASAHSEIMLYDKKKALTHNYEVGLMEFLAMHNIKLVKISANAKVKNTGDAAADVIMDANKLALFGNRSFLKEGKPITFVRRQLSAAGYPGFSVDASLERGYIFTQVPTFDTVSGTGYNLASWGLYGYESVIFTIDNPLAIVVTNDLSAAGVY